MTDWHAHPSSTTVVLSLSLTLRVFDLDSSLFVSVALSPHLGFGVGVVSVAVPSHRATERFRTWGCGSFLMGRRLRFL